MPGAALAPPVRKPVLAPALVARTLEAPTLVVAAGRRDPLEASWPDGGRVLNMRGQSLQQVSDMLYSNHMSNTRLVQI